MRMMLGTLALFVVSAFTVVSALCVFLSKRLMHAVVSLALAFLGTAVAFLVIGQTLIAILQMIVFVGGLSTYLVVAVAADERNSAMLRIPYFIAALAALLVAVALAIWQLPQGSIVYGSAFLASFSSALEGQYAVLYVITALLFGTLISSVLILRKFTKLVV